MGLFRPNDGDTEIFKVARHLNGPPDWVQPGMSEFKNWEAWRAAQLQKQQREAMLAALQREAEGLEYRSTALRSSADKCRAEATQLTESFGPGHARQLVEKADELERTAIYSDERAAVVRAQLKHQQKAK